MSNAVTDIDSENMFTYLQKSMAGSIMRSTYIEMKQSVIEMYTAKKNPENRKGSYERNS